MLSNQGENIAIKPIYVSFEPPQPAPEFLNEYGDCLSVSDVAKITGLNPQTIRSELESGTIPGTRIGKQWIIAKPAFISFLYGRLQ